MLEKKAALWRLFSLANAVSLVVLAHFELLEAFCAFWRFFVVEWCGQPIGDGRARLQPGKTVLINGATGSAGRIAVQLAKYIGAGKIIATGRNEAELEELRSLGADAVIAFKLGACIRLVQLTMSRC